MGWAAYVAHMERVVDAGLSTYARYISDMEEHGLRESYERFIDWRMKAPEGALPPADIDAMPSQVRAGAGLSRQARRETPEPSRPPRRGRMHSVREVAERKGWGE